MSATDQSPAKRQKEGNYKDRDRAETGQRQAEAGSSMTEVPQEVIGQRKAKKQI